MREIKYRVVFIYVIFLVVMILTLAGKRNLHGDEVCSYILANHVGVDPSVSFEDGVVYSPEVLFLENMAVTDSGKTFDFSNVWQNQANDVHPPFYYLLLHIICSCNVGKFSIWYAAAINICFALLTLHILRKLILLFIRDEVIVDLGSILFIFSAGILQNVSYLRMYVMAMFWVTLMAYFFVKAFAAPLSWRQWILGGGIATAGALTHYYCIIYLCASCLVLGISLLIMKRWRDIVALCITMATAAAISIAVFPAMIRHMFSGYRGIESIDNLKEGTWIEYLKRLKKFYGYLNVQIFGRTAKWIAVFSFLLFLVFILSKEQKHLKFMVYEKTLFMKWSIVCVPAMIYFFLISKMAVFVVDRYMFPIYAVAFALFWCVVNNLLRKLFENKCACTMMCMIGTILIINGFANAKWNYLYRGTEDLLHKAEEYSEENCICVYDKHWYVNQTYYELRNYKSVTFVPQENIDSILKNRDLLDDSFMLKIIGGNDEKIINYIKENAPYFDMYEKIGSYETSTTYRIFATGEVPKVQIYP